MSMSQESQDFESLRRLLALKRHEQPPPGYFHNFSSEVIARIKAGEGAHENVLERMFWEAPWLQRLWTALETKPIMAGAFGTAVCALLVAGVFYSEKPDGQPLVSSFATEPAISHVEVANIGLPSDPSLGDFTRFPSQGTLGDSMTPPSPAADLFGQLPKPYAPPASFSFPASN
jgi:hypothetical protein